MGRYRKDEEEARMSSEGYLLHLDKKLKLPTGTLIGMCRESMGGKPSERKECRVTYKGLTSKMVRVGAGNFTSVPKEIFLIESGEEHGVRRVLAQIFLKMQ